MDSIRFGYISRALVLWVIPGLAFFPSLVRADTVALVIKQSLVSGGELSPEPGIYYFEKNSMVKLNAKAKSGYRFVEWLGNVADPTASTTEIFLDQAKIIIAVFEFVKEQAMGEDSDRATISGGSSGGYARRSGFYMGAVGGGSGISYAYPASTYRDRSSPSIVIPEPATIILFGLVAIKISRKRKRHPQ